MGPPCLEFHGSDACYYLKRASSAPLLISAKQQALLRSLKSMTSAKYLAISVDSQEGLSQPAHATTGKQRAEDNIMFSIFSLSIDDADQRQYSSIQSMIIIGW